MAKTSAKFTENLCPGTDLKVITAKSYAKINLTLDILKKIGAYHLVNTILHQIKLHDELTFKQIPGNKIIIKCNNSHVPTGRTNTVYKAAQLLQQSPDTGGCPVPGIEITIKKNIPVSSGLGGGSGNAATTLKVLNKLWKTNLSNKQLQKLAAQIGTDIPFFIEGGTACGTRYGEKIKPLSPIKLYPHLIVMDSKKVSTKEMYKSIDTNKTGKNISQTKKIIEHPFKKLDITLLHNDFETAAQRAEIESLQKKLLHLGANCVHICGSGPALYALFKTNSQLTKAYKELKGQVRFIWKSN